MKKKNPNQIGKSKIKVIDKMYDWGIYVWKKQNGKWFTDGQGNVLNVPSMKGDISKIAELKKVAAHYGEPDGEAVFFAGLSRVSDEEYSEQKQRMAEGLIPNMNDLGAVHAAQQTIKKYGVED
jgi:superfamily I DNA/RNA helicase